ncbi:MAG: beta-N-acetylhexosaminidase [Frankiaceae bacterium]|nr:beta-N-acetylhexosaminidase [Frankiaceae bacterium]
MTMSTRGAAALAATTLTAAVLAVVIVAPTATEPGQCVPGAACPGALPGALPSATSAPLSPGTVPGTLSSVASASSASSAGLATPTPGPTPAPAARITAATPPVVDTSPAGRARAVFATMTRAQRIGQLFMVGNAATGVETSTLAAISAYDIGNVMLRGRSSAGVAATALVSAALARSITTATGVRAFVATDEEGGSVRVLRGPGFDAIPSALTQGTWSVAGLRTSAKRWGAQLRKAGVNLDLAPVLDVVPSAAAARLNPPIGAFNREYGYTTTTVSAHGIAFLTGLSASGVDSAVKHFPGLGRVNENTDTSQSVTDAMTTRGDPYLAPFQNAVNAGAAFLMVSSAYYSRIDPKNPAAFSPTIVTGMVRGDLGFRGVVISDDLGNARQVAAWSPGSRAVKFLAAGGDMVLTVNTALVPAMVKAVAARARTDAAFARLLNASALRILTAKAVRGLL